jgi:hypothetical protein
MKISSIKSIMTNKLCENTKTSLTLRQVLFLEGLRRHLTIVVNKWLSL